MADLSELLTVPEAAKVAGVSERTMRRWATSGQVRSVGRGHKRRVVAASLSEPAATNGQDGHEKRTGDPTVSATSAIGTATAAEADRLADLVRELTARVADLSATAALWQARAGVLEDRVRSLEAPREQPAPAVPLGRFRTGCRPPFLILALAVVVALLLAAGTLAAVWWAR